MAVGPILTLGLGAFTGGGVKYLPTLGFGTAATPPTPTGVAVGGSAGRPIFRRRNWKETKEIVDGGLRAAYLEIMGMDLSGEVVVATTKLVKPFADKQARFKKVPKAEEVDWKAMARDAELARQLLQIHWDYVEKLEFQREQDEEDEILLMLH